MLLLRRLRHPVFALWSTLALLSGCTFSLEGTLQAQVPSRFPVMLEQVRLAMKERNWPLTGSQIRLTAPVTATVAEPALEINSVTPQAEHEVMLRMACRVHTECLPFFVIATWPTEAPMPDLLRKTRSRAISTSGNQAVGTQIEASRELSTANPSEVFVPESAVIHMGSPAMLRLEGNRIHIRIRVVFAQTGHVGDTVRVTTLDRKQVYVAEVLSPELLQGEIN